MSRTAGLLPLILLTSCTPGHWKENADDQVYAVLEEASLAVTGDRKTFEIGRELDAEDRPVGTLRGALLREPDMEVELTLLETMDVAAENSREFQRQKEQLYLAALNMTRDLHEFELRWAGGGGAEVQGTSDEEADLLLRDDLSASLQTVTGTRIVASFVNDFLRSIVRGDTFDGRSILDLTITQPLLRGSGRRIVREPLTQAERDVVYQMRSFERARGDLVLRIFSDYFGILQQVADLESQERNYASVQASREKAEAEQEADRATVDDVGRSRQQELRAENALVSARARLETSLDDFKITLGLPTEARVTLAQEELDKLRQETALIRPLELTEEEAVDLALARRFDLRTVRDRVDDAARGVLVAEDALQMGLDFSAAVTVPDEPGASANLDFSEIDWAAGFDLDLALDKLAERNAYRSALINLDVAIRERDELEDIIAADIRASMRDIASRRESLRIQQDAVALARRRVEANEELYDAGRLEQLDVLDAKADLLDAELAYTEALVSYAIARLRLMHDLEALVLEPKGLRYDPALPVPEAPGNEAGSDEEKE